MSMNIELAPSAKVLYVDDEQENLDAFEYTLFERFDVHTFDRPAAALEFLQRGEEVAVIVSDIKMPDMDGFEFLHQASKVNALPVRLLLTGYNDERLAIRALNGQLCHGYHKKIEAFSGGRITEIVDGAAQHYVATLRERAMVTNTSVLLKRLLHYKDRSFTHEHVHNVELLCRHLMPFLDLPAADREMLPLAALFHDVGKLVVPDSIVTCTRGLTLEEYSEMKNHVRYGAELLKGMRGFERSLEAARDHHECFDGTGYPDGKRGEEISLFGRVVAVTDFFDALASERVYKAAVPVPDVLQMLDEDRGRKFDPDVVKVFQQMWADAPELLRHYELQNERLRLLKPAKLARDTIVREVMEDVSIPREHLDQLVRTLKDVGEAMAQDPEIGDRLRRIWETNSSEYFVRRAGDILRGTGPVARANEAPPPGADSEEPEAGAA